MVGAAQLLHHDVMSSDDHSARASPAFQVWHAIIRARCPAPTSGDGRLLWLTCPCTQCKAYDPPAQSPRLQSYPGPSVFLDFASPKGVDVFKQHMKQAC